MATRNGVVNNAASSNEVHEQVQTCHQLMRALRNLASGQNVLHDARDDWATGNGFHNAAQQITADFNRKLTALESEYSQVLNELIKTIDSIMTEVPQLTTRVIDGPFATWRLDQKMCQIGCPENGEKREQAERSLREVMSLLYFLRDTMTEIESEYSSSPEIVHWLRGKCAECRQYARYLVQKSFVVFKQPAMLVKDWTLRMDISVKVMADVPTYGGNQRLVRGPVSCCMITERQAESLRMQQTSIDFAQAPINQWSFGYLSHGMKQREMTRENCIRVEWNENNGEAEFAAVRTKIENRKTSVSKDKAAGFEIDQRVNDKKSDKMTEKKLYFLFFCQMTIDNEPTWIWTLSLPFLVAVQTMQEWHLLGVIFWDTAFSALDAVPCDGRSEVTWRELAAGLKWLFDKEVQAERGDMACRELTNEELHHLGTRIFGDKAFHENSIVQRSDIFNKTLNDSISKSNPDKGFTFWQWFYACMDLLQDKSGKILRYHNGRCRRRGADEKRTMAGLFNEGIIRGFVSRETTVRLLKACRQTNIMLIRFSDNHCRHDDPNSVPAGYLSITCKTVKDGREFISSIKPLNRELLSRLTMPFVVAHCENLSTVKYIYVGEDRWLEKKRLTFNFIPILSEYEKYADYEEVILNLNHDTHAEESPHGDSTSPAASLQSSWRAMSISPSMPTAKHIRTDSSSYGSYSDASSPPVYGQSINFSPFMSTAPTPSSSTPDTVGRPASSSSSSMIPSRLIALLTEPPSRGAMIPSKYDEVLSYLISGDTTYGDPTSVASTAMPASWMSEFQPEDEDTLCRTFAGQ